ncbi:MAG TPA: semialdehyde dehydrogenase [Planococcus sp. (in: firmicutes)]|nr:semialdehyde dehydrogenase [Planococcus sp. (in: firmicutes)]
MFVRRSLDVQHEKLKVHVIDFEKPEQWKHLVTGDVLFSCLGTTMKAAGSKDAQWKVDFDYQYRFAEAASENGVNHYVLVSSDFASPTSRNFYSNMKGKLELAVRKLAFPAITIFNPPVLVRKNSDRRMEVVGLKAVQVLNKIGIARSQQPLPTEVLAQAMVNSAIIKDSGTTKLKGKAIWERAEAKRI